MLGSGALLAQCVIYNGASCACPSLSQPLLPAPVSKRSLEWAPPSREQLCEHNCNESPPCKRKGDCIPLCAGEDGVTRLFKPTKTVKSCNLALY